MNSGQIKRIGLLFTIGFALCACQTVKLPTDLVKSPEFLEDAQNISKDYPRVSEAPTSPDDIRSAAQWDKDAKALQDLRSQTRNFAVEPGPDNSTADAEYDALKAKVQGYKKDDPQSGPIEGFPDYEPRR